MYVTKHLERKTSLFSLVSSVFHKWFSFLFLIASRHNQFILELIWTRTPSTSIVSKGKKKKKTNDYTIQMRIFKDMKSAGYKCQWSVWFIWKGYEVIWQKKKWRPQPTGRERERVRRRNSNEAVELIVTHLFHPHRSLWQLLYESLHILTL